MITDEAFAYIAGSKRLFLRLSLCYVPVNIKNINWLNFGIGLANFLCAIGG